MIPRVSLAAAGLVLLGCNDFNDGKTRSIIESNPVRLDAEQVTLTQQQVDCGVKADLWDSPVQTNDRSVARLTDKGRALKFYEDVQKEDPQGSLGGFYAKLCVANLMLKNPGVKNQGISTPAIP